MTSRERFLSAVNHQEPDRVPQLVRWGKDVGEKLAKIFGVSGPDLGVRIGNDAIVCQLGINSEMEMSIGDLEQGETYVNEWGVTYERRLTFNYPVGHPLKVKDALEKYSFPVPDDPQRMEELSGIIRKYGKEFVVIADLSCTLFEAAAAHLRGMEQFLTDCREDPLFTGMLLDKLADYHSVLGVRAIMEGADVIRIGDDIGSQKGMVMHPKLWRGLVRPRLFRMIQAFRRVNPKIIILYHSCGDFRAIIPDLIDIGVRIISSLQEVGSMNLPEIKKEFGTHLAFKGGLDTQHLLPMGTPEDVREGVFRLVRTLGEGGGYIFMPSHLLYGDVPAENIWAMLEALKDYGRYPFTGEMHAAGCRKGGVTDSVPAKDKLEIFAAMVEKGEAWQVEQWTGKLLEQGIDALDILTQGLHRGMERLVEKFRDGEAFLPEILMGDKAFHAGMTVLKPRLNSHAEKAKGVIVLGMVRNDIHDIGKNIVRIMFEMAGFRVIDLGADVEPEDFVSVIEKEGADILALSARMSTTLSGIRDVIDLLTQKGLRQRVMVMVGGAPITAALASAVGADGFALDGVSAAEKALALMGFSRAVELI